MTRVIGWDLGGANVKLASIEDGRVASVAQIPCPIIPERRKFDAAVEAALPLIALPASHAVTMTGELSDVFGDRAEGVAYLVDLMVRTVGAQPLSIYAGEAGFLAPERRQTPHARSRLSQLACDCFLGCQAPCRWTPRRCRHDDNRPHPNQSRKSCRPRRDRRRAPDRRRAALYRRGAHAGDGGGAFSAVQGPGAEDRGGTLRHHGRCLAARRRIA